MLLMMVLENGIAKLNANVVAEMHHLLHTVLPGSRYQNKDQTHFGLQSNKDTE